jgi:hypothetical protein
MRIFSSEFCYFLGSRILVYPRTLVAFVTEETHAHRITGKPQAVFSFAGSTGRMGKGGSVLDID